MNNKRYITGFLIILLFMLTGIQAFPIDITNLTYSGDKNFGRVQIYTSGKASVMVNKVGKLIIVDISDAVKTTPLESIKGDKKFVKKIEMTQYMTDPQNAVRVNIELADSYEYSYSVKSDRIEIIVGKIEKKLDREKVPEDVMVIAKQQYINEMYARAEELFAQENYDQATGLYEKIASGNFTVPDRILISLMDEMGIPYDVEQPAPVEVAEVVPPIEIPIEEEIVPPVEIPVVEEVVPPVEIAEVPVVEEIIPPVEEVVTPVEVTEVPVVEEIIPPVEEVVTPVEVAEIPIVEEVIPPVEEIVTPVEVVEIPVIEEPVVPIIEEVPTLVSILAINSKQEGNLDKIIISGDAKIYYEYFEEKDGQKLSIRLSNTSYSGGPPLGTGRFIKDLKVESIADFTVVTVELEPNMLYDIKASDNNIIATIQPSVISVEEPIVAKSTIRDYAEIELKKEEGITVVKKAILSKKKKYRGRKRITIDLRDADIRNFLRILSFRMDINIYIDPEVKGQLNTKLKNVEWEIAMDKILKNLGYTYEWEGKKTIRVTTLKKIESEKKAEMEAKKMEKNLSPLVTRIYTLSYADISKIKDFIKPLMSDRGEVEFNKSVNKLIITDIPSSFSEIERLLNDLDTKTTQVNITVRIYRLNDVTIEQIGSYWNASNEVNPLANPIVRGENNLGATIFPTGGAGIAVMSASEMLSFNAVLTALESTDRLKLISTPSVTTLNHQTARIVIGQKIPITMLDEAGNTVTQLTTIGTKIIVTPHMNVDGKIIMDIRPEVSTVGGYQYGYINIVTSEASTTLMVDDGDTAIIGGLVELKTSTTKGFVPFLGKIPILGLLFSAKSTQENRGEVLLLVTPKSIM